MKDTQTTLLKLPEQFIDNNDFKILGLFKIGTGLKTTKDILEVLNDGSFKIGDGDSVKDILNHPSFIVENSETEILLCSATTQWITKEDGVTTQKIFDYISSIRVGNLKGCLCPAEVGLQLRLQYSDQPDDEWLHIAMKPIVDSNGVLCIFNVVHDYHGLWLSACEGDLGRLWFGNPRFVFALCR